jgi:hypothetical protein
VKAETSSGRAWRWIALAIAVLGCVLTLLLVRSCGHPQKQIAAGRAPPVTTRAGPEKANARAAMQVPAPRETTATAVKDELCGVSESDSLRAAGNETLEQHVARLTEPAISRWKNSLASSEDLRRQAIGLALANARPRPSPGDAPSKDTPVNNSLVLLAMQTDDPAIYSLALHQCLDEDYAMSAGPCEALSWEHWAAIAPDNAIPWLWIAARANRISDAQGVETALANASAATEIQEYEPDLYVQAMGALPSDAFPLDKAAAGTEVDSVFMGGAPLEIASVCSQTAIQKSLRKEQCSAITQDLAKQGSTMFDLALASRLAEQLGFPEEVRTGLMMEKKNAMVALTSAPNPWTTTGPDPSSDLSGGLWFRCGPVRRYDAFVDAILAAHGNERVALAAVSRTLQGAK